MKQFFRELQKGWNLRSREGKKDKMANANDYKFDYFNVTFPSEYVAHVEINRPEKMNAFFEQ